MSETFHWPSTFFSDQTISRLDSSPSGKRLNVTVTLALSPSTASDSFNVLATVFSSKSCASRPGAKSMQGTSSGLFFCAWSLRSNSLVTGSVKRSRYFASASNLTSGM
jgi:hypothetical protein